MTHSEVAEAVRQATIRAAISAYEDAGIRGLCESGRWEAAVSAMRDLDLPALIHGLASDRPSSDPVRQPPG